MSTAGRVLAVLALLVSVGFIYLATRMLAVHKSWRDFVTTTEKQIKELDERAVQLKAGIAKSHRDLDQEQQAHQQERVVRSAEIQDQNKQIAIHVDRLREVQTDLARGVEVLQGRQAALKVRVEERDGLQQDLAQAKIDLQQAIAEQQRFSKLLAGATAAFQQATAKNRRLTAQLGELEKKVDSSSRARRPYTAAAASEQEGVVTRLSPINRTVEFDVGAEATFRVGQQLRIFRLDPAPRYLGKLEVISRNGARAIGRVTAGSDAEQIRPGDRIAKEIVAPATAEQQRE